MDNFNFQLNSRLIFGVGQSRDLPRFVAEHKFSFVMLLVDEGVAEYSAYFGEIMALLKKAATVSIITLRGNQEPDYDYLDLIASKARAISTCDLIIGIGGGSAMDLAKGVSILLTNPGSGVSYRGFDKVKNPGIPTLLIPTTAGTGSEITINAVFTDKKEMRKLGINGRYMNATWALLDAEWTESCPQRAALSAGMDAMVHTLESFMCRQHNELTRIFSREAFRLLYENLPSLFSNAVDLECRQKLLLGAYLAGGALFNSGSGISGAFSYPLGVHYQIPHGICGAIFLPSVVEYNAERGYEDYAELLHLIEPQFRAHPSESSRRFAVTFKEFCTRMKVPRYLDDWGVTRHNANEVAAMFLPLQAAFDQNPIPFSADQDARKLLFEHVRPA